MSVSNNPQPSTPSSRFAHPRVRLIAAIMITVLVAVALYIVQSQRDRVPLGPQQNVVTINPKIGVHTRLTDEVEPWKIKQTLEMVREMGAPWIVEYFPWAYIEGQPGQFDWNHSDLVIDHAQRQGLTIIARLGFVPEWARPPETSPLYLDEDRFVDFGRFAAEFARHYAGRVEYIIIWNEPNLALEWGYATPASSKYSKGGKLGSMPTRQVLRVCISDHVLSCRVKRRVSRRVDSGPCHQ